MKREGRIVPLPEYERRYNVKQLRDVAGVIQMVTCDGVIYALPRFYKDWHRTSKKLGVKFPCVVEMGRIDGTGRWYAEYVIEDYCGSDDLNGAEEYDYFAEVMSRDD